MDILFPGPGENTCIQNGKLEKLEDIIDGRPTILNSKWEIGNRYKFKRQKRNHYVQIFNPKSFHTNMAINWLILE
jgi:hypothetical protein